MIIEIPDFCLVLLVGTSSAGKSTFAKRFFQDTEIVSSDRYRERVSDDENAQDATDDAFKLVRDIVDMRLRRRKLTVIDATNLEPAHRTQFRMLAKDNNAFAVVIALDPGEDVCLERHNARGDRDFDSQVLHDQAQLFKRHLKSLQKKEGFHTVHVLKGSAQINAAEIKKIPIRSDKRGEHGPFDIIGDVHGCIDELLSLLDTLGYQVKLKGKGGARRAKTKTPPGRRAIFVGDLVDRGPNSPDVLRLVMDMCAAGHAFTVPGNHDIKLLRWLNGRNVKLTHGLGETVAQLKAEPKAFSQRVRDFLDDLVSHLWLEDGGLAIAHAGIKTPMLGRSSRAVRVFCFFGETSGETDEFGLPIRYNWAAEYKGETTIIYGHTPVPEPEWLNNTLCIDTGCVFGGKLTALRWPEREIVQVPANRMYVKPIRPMAHPPPRPGVTIHRPDKDDDD